MTKSKFGNNWQTWLAITLSLILSVVAGWITRNTVLVKGPSIDKTHVIAIPGAITHGDYVTLTIQTELLDTPETITKIAACVAGEYLSVKSMISYHCRGQYIGTDDEVDDTGRLYRVSCPGVGHLQKKSSVGYFCNSEYIGRAKERTLDGRTLSAFEFEGLIPEGKLFVFGGDINSYDSRYFGLVDISKVQRMVALW